MSAARAPPVIAMQVTVLADAAAAAQEVAGEVAELVRAQPGAVLALPAGATPVPVYRELGRRCERGEVSFARCRVFLLDEYAGLGPQDPGSFRAFAERELLGSLDLGPERLHCLDGAHRAPAEACAAYEAAIRSAGGIDLALVGLGRNGHIAFNEPGSAPDSRTRLVRLHPDTISAAAPGFPGRQAPTAGLTVGIGTILEAGRVLMLATGEHKAQAVGRALGGPVTPEFPASLLRSHSYLQVVLDEAAAALLRR